jgi:hypothetical protein
LLTVRSILDPPALPFFPPGYLNLTTLQPAATLAHRCFSFRKVFP